MKKEVWEVEVKDQYPAATVVRGGVFLYFLNILYFLYFLSLGGYIPQKIVIPGGRKLDVADSFPVDADVVHEPQTQIRRVVRDNFLNLA